MILTKYGKEEINLDSLIDDGIKSRKLDEFLFIVPTNRKIRYLKRELISLSPNGSVTGLNLETIGSFAARLLFEADDSSQLISEEAAIVLLNQSFQETDLKYFSAYKGEIPFGTLEKVKKVISEYKLHGITPKILREEAANVTGAEKLKAEDIANIYEIYAGKFNAIGVKESGDVYYERNSRSEKEYTQLFTKNYADVKKIIINGFDEFTKPEIGIINSSAEINEIELYVYFDYYKYNPLIFSHLDACYKMLTDKGFKVIKDLSFAGQNDFLMEVKEKLFLKREESVNRKFSSQLTEISAFNRENEIELIAKEIKKLILHKKVKPNKICIAFNLIKPYSPVVRDQFSLYGIPFNLTDRLSLSTSSPIMAVINLLDIIENDVYYKNRFRALGSRFGKLHDFDLTNLLNASS